MTKLEWTDLDQRAVDTARVLAMDAVQKVGNGHPGTAMALAPVAYTLFHKVMRHNPANPDWSARDRFVLSAGHSSITLYTQLYLGGFGLELEDRNSLRTGGSKTPGHPEHFLTPGVEVITNPIGLLARLPTRRAARLTLDLMADPPTDAAFAIAVWVATHIPRNWSGVKITRSLRKKRF